MEAPRFALKYRWPRIQLGGSCFVTEASGQTQRDTNFSGLQLILLVKIKTVCLKLGPGVLVEGLSSILHLLVCF